MAVNEAEVPVVLKLYIPHELYEEYGAAAARQGLTPTELILHRLQRCKDHTSLRPVYFTDSQRQQLESVLQKRPLETAEQVLALIATAMSLPLGDFNVQLSAQQLKRISMGGYAGQSAPDRLAAIIKGAISKAYGI